MIDWLVTKRKAVVTLTSSHKILKTRLDVKIQRTDRKRSPNMQEWSFWWWVGSLRSVSAPCLFWDAVCCCFSVHYEKKSNAWFMSSAIVGQTEQTCIIRSRLMCGRERSCCIMCVCRWCVEESIHMLLHVCVQVLGLTTSILSILNISLT